MNSAMPLVDVRNLRMHFPIPGGLLGKGRGFVRAVDDVSFSISQGETLGLVGESGCGKTTIGRCILRAMDPTTGEVFFWTENGPTDLMKLGRRPLKHLRRHMQMIFQDPYSSLNPRMTIREIIGEPIIINRAARGKELDRRVEILLDKVGLSNEYSSRYPHAFSGGQRQRISIARALALNPKFIVCDEAVSALDVSIQAQILNLLQRLQTEFGLTYLFISHDLSVVKHVSDRVAVMYVGKLVELAETAELFIAPRHPYTEALLSAIPEPDPRYQPKRILLEGDVADPSNPPTGCYFHPRCRYARPLCRRKAPALVETPGDHRHQHLVACHRASELALGGILLDGRREPVKEKSKKERQTKEADD